MTSEIRVESWQVDKSSDHSVCDQFGKFMDEISLPERIFMAEPIPERVVPVCKNQASPEVHMNECKIVAALPLLYF